MSIVIPALDEAPNVPLVLQRMTELSTAHPEYRFELVLVDDGSSDGTAERLLGEANSSHRITVLELARNFGSHQAISAGFKEADGSCAIVLGADIQEPQSLVADLLATWKNGAEVVWGIRRTRTRSFKSELPSRLFSYLFTRYANLSNYPAEGPSGVLVDRCVLDEINKLEERNRNIFALIAWLGFHQQKVHYDQLPRAYGKSKWTQTKMAKLAVDSLIQFSSMPLRLCTISGLAVAGIGLTYAFLLMIRALAGVSTPSGWPTVVVIVLLLGGFQLIVTGIMGEYLWRAVEEVRDRPLYVIKKRRQNHKSIPQSRRNAL